MIIYKGKRLNDKLRKNIPHGTLVCVSDTGYMNKELFQKWLEHFDKNHRYPDEAALLILDGHGSHVKAVDALKYASAHNISIICLPPHTTHWTQPLDRCFFKPLKSNYTDACRKFMKEHPGRSITRYDFPSLFSAAYIKTVSMELAVNSFRSTGIYPFSDNVFPESTFAPAATTKSIPVVPCMQTSGGELSDTHHELSTALETESSNRPVQDVGGWLTV